MSIDNILPGKVYHQNHFDKEPYRIVFQYNEVVSYTDFNKEYSGIKDTNDNIHIVSVRNYTGRKNEKT